MQEVIRKRPLGVTVIAIIEIVGAIALLLSSFGVITTVLGVGVAIGALFRLIVAWGLWTLKSWAFWTAIIVEVLHLFLNLYNLLVGHNSPVVAIVGLIVNLVVLVYLFADRNVRAAFRT